MQNPNKFRVLDGCRLALKLSNLYNQNGVYIRTFKIPNVVISTLILLPTMYYIASLEFWFCIDERFNMKSISSTLCNMIAIIQMAFVYFSLAMKSDLIIETMNHLQDVVDKSN